MKKLLNKYYPLLFALFPVLSLYLNNIDKVTVAETILPFSLSSGFAYLLLYFLNRKLKDQNKATFITTLFLLMTFSYALVAELLEKYLHYKNLLYYNPFFIVLWIAIFFIISYLIITSKPNLSGIVIFLSTMSVVLIAIPLVSLAIYVYQTKNVPVFSLPSNPLPKVARVKTSDNLPDIYYFVVDRYTSNDVLNKIYDFDNSKFTDNLASKGFYVAFQSTANYLKTAHSLASTLNLEYINYLTNEVGEESNDLIPLYAMLQDNKVFRLLKPKGYKFLHFGSWWKATSRNKLADENYNVYYIPEFTRILFQTTYVYPLSVYTGIYDFRKEQKDRVYHKFDKLSEVPDIVEPTFTFAHFLITHPPYVFDQKGNFVSVAQINSTSARDNYLNHLIFINNKLTELINHLLDSENPPIIILQSDEGPFPKRYEENEYIFDWSEATYEELSEKMGILNAMYLPGVDTASLYSTITPVNTFRYIFNKYFDSDYELLEDRNYIFPNSNYPYKFIEVTNTLKERFDNN